jgi:hypothetical protein
MHVNMAPTVGFSQAVDTPADLAKVEDLMRGGEGAVQGRSSR